MSKRNETLGMRIRRLRIERGLTLRHVAREVGVSAPFLSDLEHDRRKTCRLDAFARVLGVPVEELESVSPVNSADVAFLNEHPELLALLRRRSRKEPKP